MKAGGVRLFNRDWDVHRIPVAERMTSAILNEPNRDFNAIISPRVPEWFNQAVVDQITNISWELEKWKVRSLEPIM